MTPREQFNRQASHYDEQWAAWNRASLDWLIAHSGAAPHHRLLDVATGTGYTALGFAPLVREVVGVDVSEGMLAQARTKGMANAQFQVAPAERLPFPDAAFDLLTCRIAPHHFDSVPAFLAESYRVLAPGGRLLLADTTTPEECADWQNAVERLRDQSHVRNYTPAQWRSMAEAAGFTVEAFEILAGTVLVSLNDWLEKAGCAGAPADQVRGQFATAPATARQAFQISAREDDFEFAWLRVAFAGAKRK